jgi:hypothetical protein
VLAQRVAVEEAEGRLGVPDVDRQEHVSEPTSA